MATKKWPDLRPSIVADLGPEVLAEAARHTQSYVDAHRLAERRKALGLTQSDVAERRM